MCFAVAIISSFCSSECLHFCLQHVDKRDPDILALCTDTVPLDSDYIKNAFGPQIAFSLGLLSVCHLSCLWVVSVLSISLLCRALSEVIGST